MPKKEKKYSFSIAFQEEKMEALELYLREKDSDVELELEDFLEKLYVRTVPGSIRTYLSAKEKSAAKKLAEDTPSEPPTPGPVAVNDAAQRLD